METDINGQIEFWTQSVGQMVRHCSHNGDRQGNWNGNSLFTCSFVGPLITLFWTSGDVSSDTPVLDFWWCLFWYPCFGLLVMILLFWTSGDVSSGFQSQNGQPYSHLAWAYVIYIPWDSPLVRHLCPCIPLPMYNASVVVFQQRWNATIWTTDLLIGSLMGYPLGYGGRLTETVCVNRPLDESIAHCSPLIPQLIISFLLIHPFL